MPNLVLFAFLLTLTFVDFSVRAATERRLVQIDGLARLLVWVVAASIALSVLSFVMMEIWARP